MASSSSSWENRPSGDTTTDTGGSPSANDRSSGPTDAVPEGSPPIQPVFVECRDEFPKWKETAVSDYEWKMMKCLAGKNVIGDDVQFKDEIMRLKPVLQGRDSENDYIRGSGQEVFLLSSTL